jgi:hypothetical protein
MERWGATTTTANAGMAALSAVAAIPVSTAPKNDYAKVIYLAKKIRSLSKTADLRHDQTPYLPSTYTVGSDYAACATSCYTASLAHTAA